MKTSYILTFNDLAAFQIRIIKNNFFYKPIAFGIAIILAFIFNLFPGYMDITGNTTISSELEPINYLINVLVSSLNFCFLIFLFRNFARAGNMSRLKRNKTLIGQREIEIQEDKLVLTSEISKTEWSFKAFQRIEDYKDYYFVYTDFYSAIIFPKRVPHSNDLISLLLEKTKLNVC